MKTNWDLTVFYKDFDDPAFAADLAALPGRIEALAAMISAPADDEAAKLRGIVEALEALNETSEPLHMMVFLTLATDANHPAANAAQTPLNRAGMAFAQMESSLSRYLASLPHLDEIIERDDVLRARGFALREYAETARHQIDPALEGPVLKMQLSGGKQFSELRGKLDATVLVDYRGEQIPLSAARAKAYDADPAVRRDAYEAELAAYKKIELPMSYCLNAIKAEACTMAELKGYKDVLDMTLCESRLTARTLDAMWTAIREALPQLRGYFKAKAKLLGIDPALIEEKGAVSYEVAKAMAENVRALLGTDIGVGVTGLAGPDGDGVHEVGTVFVSLAVEGETFVKELHMGAMRTRSFIRRMAGNHIYDMMRRWLSGIDVM